MKIFWLVFVMFICQILASAQSAPPQAAGYSLVFSDDFNTLGLSPNRTGMFNWYDGVWWESTIAPYSDYSVTSGVLTEKWVQGQAAWDSCLSAINPSASNYHAFRYGYFEARMKWDTVTGSWPAFWMDSVQEAKGILTNGNRDFGEIDMYEAQGATPLQFVGTIHHWVNGVDTENNHGTNTFTLPNGTDLSGTFHTYGFLWTKPVPPSTTGRMTWYFDNQAVISANAFAIFDTQDYVPSLCSQEGVNWTAGNLTGETASTINVDVDWIRVWQQLGPLPPTGLTSTVH